MMGTPPRIVLVGAGHAHLQLLDAWSRRRPSRMALTVVSDSPEAIYSGMVPGALSGRYEAEELTVAVAPLVEAAGGELVVERATSVDPVGRRIFLEGGRTLVYDAASLNLGSVTAGQGVPGVEEHALPTRPLRRLLVEGVEAPAEGPAAVVGGGAAGAELAAALAARGEEVTLVEAGTRLLPERGEAVAERLRNELEARGITVRTGRGVTALEEGAVVLEGGEHVSVALTIWAAGAAPPPLLAASPLPLDADGFVRVRDTLQVEGHPDLFAVGDAASVAGHDLPRAGVHAVRQGPVLRRNLEAWLEDRPLRRYRPQSDFLLLLNLGDGRALGSKWGVVVTGRWVMWVKDRIDRRWVDRFRT